MTKTPNALARIITEAEARIISQKLEYWDDGVTDFALQASPTLRELQEKLKNPTRDNLPAIRADINTLFEIQSTIRDVSTNYHAYLCDLKGRFNKTFTIMDMLIGDPENDYR